MNKDFIPYNLALRLKKLGFDNVPCLAVWYDVPELSDDEYEFFDFHNHFTTSAHHETQYYAQKGYKDGILAPTFSQAFRWFDYSTDWSGFIVPSKEEGYFDWWIQNYVDPNYLSVQSDEYYTAREDAELACLEKLVELAESGVE